MATRTFVNNAVAKKEQYNIVCGGTFATGDTITLPMNGKPLVVTVGSIVTTTAIAQLIKQAWQSETLTDSTATVVPQSGGTIIGEFSEMTATYSGSTVYIVGDVSGVPHSMSAPTTSGAGTLTMTNTVVGSGPYHADNLANWKEGSFPTSSDDVVLDGPVKMLYGLSSLSAATITLTERCTSATRIGLPNLNANSYVEYRATELPIGSACVLNVRGPAGLVKLNCGANQITANVYQSGASAETGHAPIQIRGTHASNAINVFGGIAEFAARSETATLASAIQTGGRLLIGQNVTTSLIRGTTTILSDY